MRVVCNDVIPADVLLLHSSDVDGRCFIETSNIDGETNLKQRTVVQRHWGLDKVILMFCCLLAELGEGTMRIAKSYF